MPYELSRLKLVADMTNFKLLIIKYFMGSVSLSEALPQYPKHDSLLRSICTVLSVFLAILTGCATTEEPSRFPPQFEAKDLISKGEISSEKGIPLFPNDDVQIRSRNKAVYSLTPAGLILTVPQKEDEGTGVLLKVGEVFEEALQKWGNIDSLALVIDFGRTTLNTLGLRLLPPASDTETLMIMGRQRGNFVKVLNLGKDFPNGGSLVIPLKFFFGPGVGWSLQRGQVPHYLILNATKKAFGFGRPDITSRHQRGLLKGHSRWFEVEPYSLNHSGDQMVIIRIYVINL